MASITLSVPDVFPDGTTVGAYPVSTWVGNNPPSGPAAESAVVASGALTFESLTEGIHYVAWADVSGVHRYRRFLVEIPEVPLLLSLADAVKPARSLLDVSGFGISLTDDPANDRTKLEINANTWINAKGALTGAKGDGVTDDRAAIQLAINLLSAFTPRGGVVFLPAGVYKIGSPGLVWPGNSQKAIRLLGEGMGATLDSSQVTRLEKMAGGYPLISATGTGLTPATTVNGLGLRDLTLHGGSFSGPLLNLIRCSTAVVENVRLAYSTGHGIYAEQLWNSRFRNMLVEVCGDWAGSFAGTYLTTSGVSQGDTNTVHFTDCHWEACPGSALVLDGASGQECSAVVLTNCKLERNVGYALWCKRAQNCSFSTTAFQADGTSVSTSLIRVEAGCFNLAMGTLNFNGSPSTAYYLDLQGGESTCFVGNTLMGAVTAHIRIGSAVVHPVIHANAHSPYGTSTYIEDNRAASGAAGSTAKNVWNLDGSSIQGYADTP